MNVQCSSGSRSFAKLMSVLKVRSTMAGHWKFATTSWKPASKLILFQLHEKLPKNSALTILQLFSIWRKWWRWKGSVCGSRELITNQKNKKIIVWKCCFLFFCATMNRFSIRLWHVMKRGFYAKPVRTSSVDKVRRSPKALRKATLAPTKCHDHFWLSAAGLIC